jgi:hypothetical protein
LDFGPQALDLRLQVGDLLFVGLLGRSGLDQIANLAVHLRPQLRQGRQIDRRRTDGRRGVGGGLVGVRRLGRAGRRDRDGKGRDQ